MPPLIDAAILLMPVVPLLCPVLAHSIVLVVALPPVLAFLEAVAQVDLPLVTPLFFVVGLVDLAPFFVPLLLRLFILAPFFAVGLLNLTAIRLVLIRDDCAKLTTLFGQALDTLVPLLLPLLPLALALLLSPPLQPLLRPRLLPETTIAILARVLDDLLLFVLVDSALVVPFGVLFLVNTLFLESDDGIRDIINGFVAGVPIQIIFVLLNQIL